MRPRDFTTVEELPLVGGSLCLDFVNTTGNRAGTEPRERLNTYPDLITFAQRVNAISGEEAREILAASSRDTRRAEQVLREFVVLRELLYRLLLCAFAGETPSQRDLAAFNEVLAQSSADRKIGWCAGKPQWVPPEAALDLSVLTSRLTSSASKLLTTENLDLLRKCGECDWLFLDQSKNRSRRWCKKTCGDRVKARRYYSKRVAQA